MFHTQGKQKEPNDWGPYPVLASWGDTAPLRVLQVCMCTTCVPRMELIGGVWHGDSGALRVDFNLDEVSLRPVDPGSRNSRRAYLYVFRDLWRGDIRHVFRHVLQLMTVIGRGSGAPGQGKHRRAGGGAEGSISGLVRPDRISTIDPHTARPPLSYETNSRSDCIYP